MAEARPSTQQQPSAYAQPRIHEATRAADGSGAVIRGAEIDEATAVQLRHENQDIVVCGDDKRTTRLKAAEIEQAVGPWMRQNKHTYSAGPEALPHFQQKAPPPKGHSFYETEKVKARTS